MDKLLQKIVDYFDLNKRGHGSRKIKRKDACSHLLYSTRVRTGAISYDCTSEHDLAATCAQNGWCPMSLDEQEE